MSGFSFDEKYYLAENPDVAAAVAAGQFTSAYDHYVKYGSRELRDPNADFSAQDYAAANPDVVAAVDTGIFASVWDHYVNFGLAENRAPNSALTGFSSASYLAANPDVAAAVNKGIFASALDHYLQFGRNEQRPGVGSDQTFTLTSSAPSVNEGDTVFVTLNARNAAQGASYQYKITGISAEDLDGGSLTGTFTVDASGQAIVALKLKADALTEGTENLKVELLNGKASATVAVNDTSLSTVQGFALTAGPDSIVGTGRNDTINATDTTITPLDVIDGGAGVDTLVINDVSGSADLSLLTVSNVENLVLVSRTGLNGGAADVTEMAGLTSATFDLKAPAAKQTITAAETTDVTVSSKLAAQDLTVAGGNAVKVAATGVTTAKIGVEGAKGDVAISSVVAAGTVATPNAAGAITVAGGAATTTVSVKQTLGANATAGAVAVTDLNSADAAKADVIAKVMLDGYGTGSTVASDALTNLSLYNSNGTVVVTNATKDHTLWVDVNNLATGASLTDAEAKTLNIVSVGKASEMAVSAAKATAITVSGDQALTIGASTLTALETITVTNTKGVTVSDALATGVVFTGGVGADTITVGATTKLIKMGDGDDVVTLTGATLGTNGSIDGGAGTDVLKMSAADAATASAGTSLNAAISGFEQLDVGTLGAATVDLANLGGISHVTVSGATAGGTLTNLNSGGTIVLNAPSTLLSVGVKDAGLGTQDVMNLAIKGTTTVAAGEIAAPSVETVNVTTDDTATEPTGIQHTATLTDAAAKTITVSGDAGLALTFTGTALTSFDASGVTKGNVSWTTAALANAATIKGGAGDNAINFTLATKTVSYEGGAGVDTVTANNQDNTIKTGAGNDAVVLGAGKNTVDLGAGDDTVTLGANLSTVTLGDGKDTVIVTTVTNANTYSTITDFAVGADKLQFANNGTETFAAAKIALANTAGFLDYVNAASAGNGSSNGAVSWFQFGGDTFVVYDVSTETVFKNGADTLVKLAGTHDLSGLTVADIAFA